MILLLRIVSTSTFTFLADFSPSPSFISTLALTANCETTASCAPLSTTAKIFTSPLREELSEWFSKQLFKILYIFISRSFLNLGSTCFLDLAAAIYLSQ